MGKRRFAGSVKGPNQTPNSRYHSEGMEGHIRGWDQGIRVVTLVNSDGVEEYDVYVTSGSNGGANDKLVGCLVKGKWFGEKVRAYV